MHMADALISTVVGGTMIGVSSGIMVYSSKKVQINLDDSKIPLMGVMGAFVFAAQMINFAIPATGSSGHIGGGMLLAILLGPYAGFLTIASVLLIQALFFGDGGLLAYGCNVFNLGFYTCFISYPYIYKAIIKKEITSKKIFIASIIASIIGLQLGSLSVVIETLLSGKTELIFSTFLMLMQPIHLAIGVIEGIVTATVVSFLWKARPEIINKADSIQGLGNVAIKRVFIGFIIASIIIGGGISWFASSNPDGLEWAIFKTTGKSELSVLSNTHETVEEIQSKTAFLPDYNFKTDENEITNANSEQAKKGFLSYVDGGTSVSGIVGVFLTLGFIVATGIIIKIVKARKRSFNN